MTSKPMNHSNSITSVSAKTSITDTVGKKVSAVADPAAAAENSDAADSAEDILSTTADAANSSEGCVVSWASHRVTSIDDVIVGL